MKANLKMPQLGVGTYRLLGDVAYQSVKDALALGYRHIDTAQVYGNEQEVGQAIRDSGIARDALFVTTKVWNDKLNSADLLPSVEESLTKLGLDYVDLLLVYWPSPENGCAMSDYMAAMLNAKAQGFTRHIGVSNFTISNLQQALPLVPQGEIYTNQVEVHPYLTNTKLRDFCRQQGIHITGYMPFAVGKVLKDEVINAIAASHQVTPAQVVVAWELAHGMATIPSSTKRANLASNLAAQALTLSDEELRRIDALDRGDRQAAPDFSPEWD